MSLRNKLAAMTATISTCLVMAAAPSHALTLQADFVRTDMGDSVTIKNNGTSENVFAGQLNLQIYGGTGYSQLEYQYDTYCVDLQHTISPGAQFLVNPQSTSTGLNMGGQIAYLYDKYALGLYGSSYVLNTNDQVAGLQIAIWNLLDDSSYTLQTSSGNFQLTTTGAMATDAQTYLTDASTHSDYAMWLSEVSGGQSQLAPNCGPFNGAAVPEAGTMTMFGSAICASGLFGFRIRKASRRA
jgi:hypothetical protein